MQIEIYLDGKTYRTTNAPSTKTLEEMAEQFYKIVGQIDKAKFNLEDGSILVLPIDAIRRAHLVFKN